LPFDPERLWVVLHDLERSMDFASKEEFSAWIAEHH
jgi:hypothetical protein